MAKGRTTDGETFEDRDLEFVYQESTADGSQSNFGLLTRGDREDA